MADSILAVLLTTLGYLAILPNNQETNMNPKAKQQFTARANILKALAHPTRLFIVDALQKKVHSVRKLTDMIGADISTVSKHLTVLKNAGLVYDEKIGSTVFYRLRVPCVLEFMSCIEAVLKANANQQQEVLTSCKSC